MASDAGPFILFRTALAFEVHIYCIQTLVNRNHTQDVAKTAKMDFSYFVEKDIASSTEIEYSK